MPENESTKTGRSLKQIMGLMTGVVLALAILIFGDFQPGHPEVTRCAAVAVLMAVWWITEAIPIPSHGVIAGGAFSAAGNNEGQSHGGDIF